MRKEREYPHEIPVDVSYAVAENVRNMLVNTGWAVRTERQFVAAVDTRYSYHIIAVPRRGAYSKEGKAFLEGMVTAAKYLAR